MPKPFMTYEQQLTKLKEEKHILIPDEVKAKARECFKTIKVTKPKYRQVKQRHENRQPSFHTG